LPPPSSLPPRVFVDFVVTAPIRPRHREGLARACRCRLLPPPFILAVIFVAITPSPAFARQHCRRRHHCLLLLPLPTPIALSTAHSHCSHRDDIAVAVIAATSSSSRTTQGTNMFLLCPLQCS
jgi:hypothetical protein